MTSLATGRAQDRGGKGRWVWLGFGLLYFVVPLIATAEFSLNLGRQGYSLGAYRDIASDPEFRRSLAQSFQMALGTIFVALLLMVPTAYWVHLRLPRFRPVIDVITVLPIVVPPIVLVVGVLDVFGDSPEWFIGSPRILSIVYVVLAFPFMYRALDAGLRSIDIHTLTEASRGLGASWPTTLWRVILPNLRSAVLGGAFLTLALVLGEFTMANLMLFRTFPVYVNYIGETQAQGAAALSLMSFAITWLALLGIVAVGRQRGVRNTALTPAAR